MAFAVVYELFASGRHGNAARLHGQRAGLHGDGVVFRHVFLTVHDAVRLDRIVSFRAVAHVLHASGRAGDQLISLEKLSGSDSDAAAGPDFAVVDPGLAVRFDGDLGLRFRHCQLAVDHLYLVVGFLSGGEFVGLNVVLDRALLRQADGTGHDRFDGILSAQTCRFILRQCVLFPIISKSITAGCKGNRLGRDLQITRDVFDIVIIFEGCFPVSAGCSLRQDLSFVGSGIHGSALEDDGCERVSIGKPFHLDLAFQSGAIDRLSIRALLGSVEFLFLVEGCDGQLALCDRERSHVKSESVVAFAGCLPDDLIVIVLTASHIRLGAGVLPDDRGLALREAFDPVRVLPGALHMGGQRFAVIDLLRGACVHGGDRRRDVHVSVGRVVCDVVVSGLLGNG